MRILTAVALLVLMASMSIPVNAQEVAETGNSDTEPASKDVESGTNAGDSDRRTAEKVFQKLLTGATLVGNFTIDKDGPVDPTKLLKPDRYELATVNKVKDDFWLFVYVHKGVPIPLTMKVLWAGKTPVLTLDEFTIAGMGTYSARLMFHGDRYAGTWQHGATGGLMFGKIETAEYKQKKATLPAKKVVPPEDAKPAAEDEK